MRRTAIRRAIVSHRPRADRALVREWAILELAGHVCLIALRQLCGTQWTWAAGGPFAYIDVSRAMLHGDALWVVAVVCTSAIRRALLAEWSPALPCRRAYAAWAWLPWLPPGCLVGWAVLIRDDAGAAFVLALPGGLIFEAFHVLFFGYVAARIAGCALQLAASARLLAARCRRALAVDGPWPYIPLGISAIAGLAILCAALYLHIYQQGGSFQARWEWFAPEQA